MKYSIRWDNFRKIIETLSESDPKTRIEFFGPKETDDPHTRGHRFFLWWFFYFHYNFIADLADFHTDWIEAITDPQKSVMLVGFRGSLKTEIVKLYLTYTALYKIEKYIVVQSYDNNNSAEILGSVAKLLTTDEIVADYGNIFPFYKKKDEILKASTKNFDTTNGVKFVAKGLWSSLRGVNTFNKKSGSSRPTLLVLDDIDTSDSTANPAIIEKNYRKITGETLGAMDKQRSRVIFLGNIIVSDGVVPRWIEAQKFSKKWKIFKQPILKDLDKNNLTPENIAWSFFTPTKILEMMGDEKEMFDPNNLLIPRLTGSHFFPVKTIQSLPTLPHTVDEKYRDLHWYRPIPAGKRHFMGVDTSRGTGVGDYSTISVRDEDRNLICSFYAQMPSDELVEVIEYLVVEKNFYGRIGIEINNSGYSTIDIAKKRYWSHLLFRRQNIATTHDQPTETLGWWTGTGTREIMLADYEQALRKSLITEMDERVKAEAENFQVINDKPQAMLPHHDDGIMADAICLQMFKYPY